MLLFNCLLSFLENISFDSLSTTKLVVTFFILYFIFSYISILEVPAVI